MKKKHKMKIVIDKKGVFNRLFRFLFIYLLIPCSIYLVLENAIGDISFNTFIAVFASMFVTSMIGLIINYPKKLEEVRKGKGKKK